MVYKGTEVQHIPSLKNKDRKLVLAEVALVNGLLHNLSTVNISESNRLLYASAFVVAERLGMIKKRVGGPKKAKKEPWWKRRIEKKVKEWRKDLSRIEVCAFLKSKIFNRSIKVKSDLCQQAILQVCSNFHLPNHS